MRPQTKDMKANKSTDYMFDKKAWSSIAEDTKNGRGKTVQCLVNVGGWGDVNQKIKHSTVLSRGPTTILRGVSKYRSPALILSVTFLLVKHSWL